MTTLATPVEVRFAPDRDTALERLADKLAAHKRVVLVSSDSTSPRGDGTGGHAALGRARFSAKFSDAPELPASPAGDLADKLDEETRARLKPGHRN